MKGITVTVLAFRSEFVDVKLTDYWNDNGRKLPDATLTVPIAEFWKHMTDDGITKVSIGIPFKVKEA